MRGLPVSILYEADRLCNLIPLNHLIGFRVCFNPLRGRQTLQLVSSSALMRRRVPGFNPLRGRQTLQHERRGVDNGLGVWFQSSTRQTDFATALARSALAHIASVSILYEADRLCNSLRRFQVSRDTTKFQSSTRQTDFATGQGRRVLRERLAVSILYEADRLCNVFLLAPGAYPLRRFNPLRGRQTLQPAQASGTGSPRS